MTISKGFADYFNLYNGSHYQTSKNCWEFKNKLAVTKNWIDFSLQYLSPDKKTFLKGFDGVNSIIDLDYVKINETNVRLKAVTFVESWILQGEIYKKTYVVFLADE